MCVCTCPCLTVGIDNEHIHFQLPLHGIDHWLGTVSITHRNLGEGEREWRKEGKQRGERREGEGGRVRKESGEAERGERGGKGRESFRLAITV